MSFTLLSKSQTGDFTFDATSGLVTGVANVKEDTIVNGAIKGITNKLTPTGFSIGQGATVAEVVVAGASALLARKQVGASFSWNPWSKNA